MVDELIGLISIEEGSRLRDLAASVPSGMPIIEIGSHKGMSTTFIAAGAPNCPVYAVDLWDLGGQKRWEGLHADPDTFETFLRQTAPFQNITPIKSASLDAARVWTGSIGMLFIDGDHSYEGCHGDYEAWTKFLVGGGILAIHDYHPTNKRRLPIRRVVGEAIKDGFLFTGVTHRLWTAVRP